MRSVVIIGLLIVSAVAVFLLVFSEAETESARPGRGPVPITEYVVEQKPFQSQVRALGTLRAKESVDITASVAETVTELHFVDGQQAQQGQLLVTLKQDEEQASLREQEAVLAEQEREVRRLVDLARKNQVAQTDLDQRRTLAAIARNKIEQMHARIDDRNIHAPFGGVLGLREVSPGAFVSPGERIISLDDISSMRLDMTVPSVSLGFLNVGQQVEANTAAYAHSFSGELVAVDTRIDPVSRSVTARAVFDNPQGKLKPGMLMRVVLVGPQRQSLLIPEESIISRSTEHFVWLIDGDVAKRHQVQVGDRRPGWVEVTAGLQAGSEIVRDGVARLRGLESAITRVSP